MAATDFQNPKPATDFETLLFLLISKSSVDLKT